MTDFGLVFAVAIGTLAMRASMVTLLADVTIPLRVEQALSLVAPAVLDREIAKLKLESMGIGVDTLTPEQELYLSSWDMGT